mmetsp:Transcript_8929/g.18962  ORF Transcript_8929/g.18962 Transcript_8929/m.18962 type:complete len:238 (+) Transcript_8929:831-1544(+)
MRTKHAQHISMPTAQRVINRRALISILCIKTCTVQQQQLRHVRVSLRRGEMQRRARVVVFIPRAHARHQPLTNQINQPTRRKLQQLQLHHLLFKHLSLRPKLLQHLNHIHPFVLRRVHDGRRTPPVLRLDIRSVFDKNTHDFRVAFRARQVQRSPLIVIRIARRRALRQLRLHAFQVSLGRVLQHRHARRKVLRVMTRSRRRRTCCHHARSTRSTPGIYRQPAACDHGKRGRQLRSD